jgi:hypothetical protein
MGPSATLRVRRFVIKSSRYTGTKLWVGTDPAGRYSGFVSYYSMYGIAYTNHGMLHVAIDTESQTL